MEFEIVAKLKFKVAKKEIVAKLKFKVAKKFIL